MNWFEQMKQDMKGVQVTKFKTFQGGGEYGKKGGFEATFMLDGKQLAQVQDANYGGPLQINATPEYYALAAKHAVEKGEDEYEKGSAFAYSLVGAHETLQGLKRRCRTTIIAIAAKHTTGQSYIYKATFSPEIAAKLRERDGADLYFVNEHI